MLQEVCKRIISLNLLKFKFEKKNSQVYFYILKNI